MTANKLTIESVIEEKCIEFANTIDRGTEQRAFLRKALHDIAEIERTRCVEIVEKKKQKEECVLHEEFGYHGKDCWDTCMEVKNKNEICDDIIKDINTNNK